MFILWCLTIVISLLYTEAVIYFLYLIIKFFTKRNIKINYTKKTIRRILVGNVIACLLVIGISMGYNSYNHIGKNEIGFQSQHDIKEVTELLDKNNMDYKVLFGKKIKMENLDDVQRIIKILEDTDISFRLT
jgi:hypothetical protein